MDKMGESGTCVRTHEEEELLQIITNLLNGEGVDLKFLHAIRAGCR